MTGGTHIPDPSFKSWLWRMALICLKSMRVPERSDNAVVRKWRIAALFIPASSECVF
jgi:hypothetical protein